VPLRSNVANRQKFRLQNVQVAPEKFQQPRKFAAEFYADFPKNGRKGAEFVCFLLKIRKQLVTRNRYCRP
jgi:hypothetical protein